MCKCAHRYVGSNSRYHTLHTLRYHTILFFFRLEYNKKLSIGISMKTSSKFLRGFSFSHTFYYVHITNKFLTTVRLFFVIIIFAVLAYAPCIRVCCIYIQVYAYVLNIMWLSYFWVANVFIVVVAADCIFITKSTREGAHRKWQYRRDRDGGWLIVKRAQNTKYAILLQFHWFFVVLRHLICFRVTYIHITVYY